MNNMEYKNKLLYKTLRAALSFICMLTWGVTVLPTECRAGDWDFLNFGPTAQSASKEEEAAAKRSVKIEQLLEKAREMRFQGRFSQARSYAESALRMEKDNKLAADFLKQLDAEEKIWKEDRERIKRKKEEAVRAKKEAAIRAKEEKEARKRAAAEEKRLAEEEARREKAAAEEKVEVEKKAMPSAVMTTITAEIAPAMEAPPPSGEMTTIPAWREQEMAKEAAEREAAPSEEARPVSAEGMPSMLAGKEEFKLKPGQPIIVNGDKVEYFEEGKILAEGNVSITYGDVKLFSDKIVVDTKSRQALCEGHVRIEHPDGKLTGDRIRYDLANRRGDIVSGEVQAYPWFGKAKETARVSEKEYLLRGGCVTTCDLDEPHYRLAAKEIRFFPDDKIIAKNVVMYIGKMPVMYIPYYYQPIIENRAKVQLIPGNNSDWGYFLLTAWRFYLKGNTKVDFLLDYRTQKGFAEGANIYYHMEDFGLKGFGEGVFRAYFIEQNDWGTYDKKAFRDEGTKPKLRKRFQWKHRVDFDPGTVGLLEFNEMSDPDVIKDYFYNEFEEDTRTLPSYISVISAKENYIFSFQADKRYNSFDTVVQRMPELKIDVPDQRLWDMPLYYTNQMSATNFEKKYAYYSLPPEREQRFDTFHRLTYVTGIGPVNLQPYGEIRETVYSRNKWEAGPRWRQTVGAGLNSFAQFHRIYDYNTDFAGLDINGLRHVIVPGALYFFQDQPNVDKDNLYQMDEIDTLEKENGLRLSLYNKLQTKRHSLSDPTKMEKVDLLRFTVYTDYLFRLEKNGLDFEKPGKFSDPHFDLELYPYDWLYIQSKMSVTPKNQALNTGSIEFSLRPGDRFRLDLGYRYEKRPDDPANQLTFDTSYIVSPKWKLGLYERWNFQDARIEEQQFTITRDLHCWEVELSYDVDGPNLLKDNFTIWFAFKIKAFPDLQIGLDRSYTKTAPGSMRENVVTPPTYPR